jgi:hypothetical protein
LLGAWLVGSIIACGDDASGSSGGRDGGDRDTGSNVDGGGATRGGRGGSSGRGGRGSGSGGLGGDGGQAGTGGTAGAGGDATGPTSIHPSGGSALGRSDSYRLQVVVGAPQPMGQGSSDNFRLRTGARLAR